MKKALFLVILLVATVGGAWDYEAKADWMMFMSAEVADGARWEEVDRPGAIRLIMPCGGRIHWGFAVRVMTPVTSIAYHGTKTIENVTMAPEYVTTEPIVFDQKGTYILQYDKPGFAMLYVRTTCE